MKKVVGTWCLKSALSKTNKKPEHQTVQRFPVETDTKKKTHSRQKYIFIAHFNGEGINDGPVFVATTETAALKSAKKYKRQWQISEEIDCVEKLCDYFPVWDKDFTIGLMDIDKRRERIEALRQRGQDTTQKSITKTRKPRQAKKIDDNRQILSSLTRRIRPPLYPYTRSLRHTEHASPASKETTAGN